MEYWNIERDDIKPITPLLQDRDFHHPVASAISLFIVHSLDFLEPNIARSQGRQIGY
jgi:hypothetical protein